MCDDKDFNTVLSYAKQQIEGVFRKHGLVKIGLY